jgi:hypothetical protein
VFIGVEGEGRFGKIVTEEAGFFSDENLKGGRDPSRRRYIRNET